MKIRDMTRCALFAALMVGCAWLAVPVGDIRLSMQTFGIFLALGLLGGRLGSVSCLVYLLLGALGMPVFTGFQGGIGVLLGPTGGYLWGFLAGSLVYWLLERRVPMWAGMAVCLLICHICGTVWFYQLYAGSGVWLVILKCVVPYLLPDTAKLLLALSLTKRYRL